MGGSGRGCGGVSLLVLAAAGLLLLTGCLGGDGGERLNETDVEAAGEQATDSAGGAPGNGTAPRLAFEGPDVETNVSGSGTFTIGEGAFAGGFLRGTDTREHDLTSTVPTQAPVSINVTISYDGEASQLNAYWSIQDAEVFDSHYHKDVATNTIWMEALIARPSNGGSVVALVQADTAGASPERSYELEATITSHGDELMPLVPASIPVTEASGGFELAVPGDGALGEVLVWDAEGDFVDRLQPEGDTVDLAVGDEDPVGRYVALALPAETGQRVPATPIEVRPVNASQAPEDPLELVATQRSQGDWHGMSAGQTANWSFEREGPPLQAGIAIRPTTTIGAMAGPGAYSMTLTSPAGTVVEASSDGLLFTGGTFVWSSPYAAESLVAGTYQAEASVGAGTPHEASHFVVELAP